MQLYLTNSLGRAKQAFTPIDPNNVRMYFCGPTVYSYAHIGNGRAAVVGDTLRRVLKALYKKVTFVSNITDIEDKIMDAAKAQGVAIDAITTKYADIFNADVAALNVQAPDYQPRATQYVPQMIALIADLITNGHAYENEGHVLFNVPSFAAYGALSGRSRDEQIAGARVEVAPYKKDPADFVLWKPSTPDQPGWDSPWGRGRPGWHIECSAMSKGTLGDVFDIHGGGLDLTFPHHENEIAQSCCGNKTDRMANYWVHNGFLMVEGQKMSKSLGNVWLIHDLLQEYSGEALRFALLSAHYHQPLDLTQRLLVESEKTMRKFYDAAGDAKPADTVDEQVMAAMCDDLNTPAAYARLHALTNEGNGPALLASARFLGLMQTPAADYYARFAAKVDPARVESLLADRTAARAAKNWAESDRIRDELLSMGVTIKDGPTGTTWSV